MLKYIKEAVIENLQVQEKVETPAIATDEIGAAPIVFSSSYPTIQEAMDAAAGGTLIIDDTKTEDGIAIGSQHAEATVRWIGDNAILQPDNPTLGRAVFRAEDNLSSDVPDLTFVDMRIKNPSLGDADVENEDSIGNQADRTSAFEWNAPDAQSVAGELVRPTFFRPHIDHVNGYGINVGKAKDSVTISNPRVYHTAFDGCYEMGDSGINDGVDVRFTDVEIEDTGRHGVTTAGDPVEDTFKATGTVKRPYTAGCDIEDGGPSDLDLTIIEPGRGGTNPIDGGLHTTANSGPVSGRVEVINTEAYVHEVNAKPDGLTIIARRTDGTAENPGGVNPMIVQDSFEGGNLTVIARGGGLGQSWVEMRNTGTMSLDVSVVGSYGPSLELNGASKADISLKSVDPCQGGANAQDGHIWARNVTGSVLDNLVEIVAEDNDGNVSNAINVDVSGDGDYNRYEGNVRGAYTSAATNNIGSNSDTSDLIT